MQTLHYSSSLQPAWSSQHDTAILYYESSGPCTEAQSHLSSQSFLLQSFLDGCYTIIHHVRWSNNMAAYRHTPAVYNIIHTYTQCHTTTMSWIYTGHIECTSFSICHRHFSQTRDASSIIDSSIGIEDTCTKVQCKETGGRAVLPGKSSQWWLATVSMVGVWAQAYITDHQQLREYFLKLLHCQYGRVVCSISWSSCGILHNHT